LNAITCNRDEIRITLEEILGHILLTRKFPHHVFFLLGGGYNGKSTFLEMINNFAGNMGKNLSLDAFNDPTCVASLNGKLCNCSDETDDIYIDKCKGYKSLASGNTIEPRGIYVQPKKVKNTATLILSANNMPVFKDKTDGFYRRLVIIPFDFKITDKNKIPEIDDLLSTDNAKSYILNLALNGVKRIKSNNYKMTANKYADEKFDEYILETDSVASFLKSYPHEINNQTTDIVYADYVHYCDNLAQIGEFEPEKILPKTQFSRRLRNYGYKSTPATINGNPVRVYKKLH